MGPELRIAHGSSRSQTSGRCSHSFLESHPLGEFRLKTHFLGEFRVKTHFLGEKKAPAGTYTANSLHFFPKSHFLGEKKAPAGAYTANSLLLGEKVAFWVKKKPLRERTLLIPYFWVKKSLFG